MANVVLPVAKGEMFLFTVLDGLVRDHGLNDHGGWFFALLATSLLAICASNGGLLGAE